MPTKAMNKTQGIVIEAYPTSTRARSCAVVYLYEVGGMTHPGVAVVDESLCSAGHVVPVCLNDKEPLPVECTQPRDFKPLLLLLVALLLLAVMKAWLSRADQAEFERRAGKRQRVFVRMCDAEDVL